MSIAAVSSKIHAGLLERTGEAHAAESVMYGVPLGMLSLLNIPFQVPASIKSPANLQNWVQSVVMDFAVVKVQDEKIHFAVKKQSENKKLKIIKRNYKFLSDRGFDYA